MKKIFVLSIGFFFFAGCTKESNPVTNYIYTHSDSALVGDMVGYVGLYDTSYFSYNNNIAMPNAGGVSVSLDGTPFKTVSDSSGRWMLKNIPAGTYAITFAKPGFALAKEVAYKFVGNGTDLIYKHSLYQVPTLHPTLVLRAFEDGKEAVYKDTFYVYAGDTVYYKIVDSVLVPGGIARFTGGTKEKNNGAMSLTMTLFLSKTPHPDPLDPNSYQFSSSPIYIYGGDFLVHRDTLYSAGFAPNDKIYCIAAAETIQCYYGTSYFDINSGKIIYTGFCPIYSEEKNFILP